MNVRLKLKKEDGTCVGRDSDLVLFVEADNHQCIVHFATETLIYPHCLCKFLKDYPDCGFVLVHRSYLLNFIHVNGYKTQNRACLNAEGIPPVTCNPDGFALVMRWVDEKKMPGEE